MSDNKLHKPSPEPDVENKKDEKDINYVMTKVKCHSNGALSKKLGAYFNETHFHDVVLKLPNTEYKAHRLVLCVWSEYFKEKLQGPSRSRAPSTLELNDLTDAEGKAFEHLLRFMYTGEVTPRDDNVLDICRLTEKYQVKELRRLCEEWIGSNIGDHNVIGASARLRDAEKLGLAHLTEKCREIFCHYFTRLPETTWASLSSHHIEEILKSSEVVVEDEFHVLKKLESWVKSNGGIEKQKDALVEKLLPQIRFRFLTAVQLKQVREDSMGEILKQHLPGVLEDAFEFRAVAGEQSKVLGSREDAENSQAYSSAAVYNPPRLYFDFDFAGPSQSRSSPFRSYRINNYNTESRPVVVFNNDGHCWRDSRDWRFECKAFQDTTDKEQPYRLRFTLSPSDRVQRRYHIAFLIRESKIHGQQAAAGVSEPELLVMVSKGVLSKEDDSEYVKKITMVTPPIFDKSPREIDLCFVGNCFLN